MANARNPGRWSRRVALLLVAISGLLPLTACRQKMLKKAGFSESTRAKLAQLKNEDKSKSRYLSIEANKREDGAEASVPLPYELYGEFRVELTFGVYSAKRAGNLGDGHFGLRVSNAEDAGEYYAVYARYQAKPEGLEVYAESHEGLLAPAVFVPFTQVEAAVESDGIEVTLSWRPAGTAAPAETLATTPLVGVGLAHQPGFVVEGITDRAQVGFTNLTVPLNSAPLMKTAKTRQGRLVEAAFLEGVRSLFRAFDLSNQGIPEAADVDLMDAELTAARQAFDAARVLADGLMEPTCDIVDRELARIDQDLGRVIDRTDAADPRSAGRAVLNVLASKMPRRVQTVLEALENEGGGARPPGLDLYTIGNWALINNTGRIYDVIDVWIDVHTVTVTMPDGEGGEVDEPGAPFLVKYREEAPDIYNDEKNNYADRVFPGHFFSITDYLPYVRPPGAIRVRYEGRITVFTHQFGTFGLDYDQTF